jgi:hypothetical protein
MYQVAQSRQYIDLNEGTIDKPTTPPEVTPQHGSCQTPDWQLPLILARMRVQQIILQRSPHHLMHEMLGAATQIEG